MAPVLRLYCACIAASQIKLFIGIKAVVFVRYLFQPFGHTPVQGLLDGDVGHTVTHCRPMPVFFARRYPDGIASLNDLRRFVSKPDKAKTANHVQCLPQWVCMPCCACTGFKRHIQSPNSRWFRSLDDRVLPYIASKPIG